MKTTYYNRGDIVVLRQMWKGKVLWAQPLRVVEDTPDMIICPFQLGVRPKYLTLRDSMEFADDP